VTLRAPFPWFGGKSRVARLVWERFGDVPNYVEPFAGSMAVLLARPTEARIETVNDLDCYISNFWRALQADPEELAAWADWPVNEADLHARHRWLVGRAEFRKRMRSDPDFYDPKIAGWWVWGISQWDRRRVVHEPGMAGTRRRVLGSARGAPPP
jgi:DNA adenine methylase